MIRIGDGWLYARKSAYHGRQKDRGRSVDEQLTEEREWCEENEVTVGDQYIDDDRSASPMAAAPREEFERLLADIQSGRIKRGDVVVAWEASRLHRDLEIYIKLRNACWHAGVYWCINGDLYDLSKRKDRKRSAQDAIEAEDQAYEISDRVQRSMRANARLGRPHAKTLFGYTRRYDSRTGDLLDVVINEEEAAIVREIFERVAAHETQLAILRDFNSRGVPSPSRSCCNRLIGAELKRLREGAGMSVEDVAGAMQWTENRLERVEAGTWGLRLDDLERMCQLTGTDEVTAAGLASQWRSTPQWATAAQIKKIVKNPAYMGRRHHKGKDFAKAIWPPIVDAETFHSVALILADPSRRTQKTTELTHLLVGLAHCRVDGCKGVARSAGFHSTGGWRVYKCDDRYCFQVRAEVVERYVVAQLVLRFARHDAAELFAVRGTNDERTRELKANITEWEAALAEADQKAAKIEITLTRLANLEALIAPKIKKAQEELGRARINPLLSKLIKPDAEAVYAEWQRMTLAQQRAVIRSELEIAISPVGKGRRHRPVEEYVELSWRRPAAA